jgi:hypothetical protein
MTQLNFTAIKAMAIATAYFQRDWTPGTGIEEVYDDFDAIRLQAADNLAWAGITDTVSDYEVANAIWGIDEDDYIDFMMAVDQENEQTDDVEVV